MPSTRRVKVLAIAVVIAIVFFFYYTGDAQNDGDFYHRTVTAMDAVKAQDTQEHDVQELLKTAKDVGSKSVLSAAADTVASTSDEEDTASSKGAESTSEQAPLPNQPLEVGKGRKYSYPEDSMEDKSVAGRKSMKIDKSGKGSEKVLDGAEMESKTGDDENVDDKRDSEAETELNAILKKSPIIIFSKSYCPYSRKAKTLLLETYKIVPSPYVVELDLMTETSSSTEDSDSSSPKKFSHPDDVAQNTNLPMGKRLQNLLAENTGRSTVPNILVNGRSIGGSDDIAELERGGKLGETIRKMAGKRITAINKPGDKRKRREER